METTELLEYIEQNKDNMTDEKQRMIIKELLKLLFKDEFDVFGDIKNEIYESMLDKPVENGTNEGMACYNGGLMKALDIIDEHIKSIKNNE